MFSDICILWGLFWFQSTLKINKSQCYIFQLDFDFGNSVCGSDVMAVCKH